jgi:membrane protein implicated in regulation of membrane protease activity
VEVPTGAGGYLPNSPAGPNPATRVAHGTTVRPPGRDSDVNPQDQGRFGTWSVFILILAATTLAGFADEFLFGGSTWLTGAVFVASSILAALLVRRRDMVTAVISPPLAFLVALLITAQADALRGGGNLFVKEASALVTGLAFNAPWVFGGTLAALVIVAVRRLRLRSRDRASHAGR